MRNLFSEEFLTLLNIFFSPKVEYVFVIDRRLLKIEKEQNKDHRVKDRIKKY